MLDARTSGRRGPFASDEGVVQLLTTAGLTDVRTAHRTVEAVFRDTDHFLEFSWSHGQRAMWEAVPEAKRDGLRERISATVADVKSLRFMQQVRYTIGHRP